MFEVTVSGAGAFADGLRIPALLLPWAGYSAGQEEEPNRRWNAGRSAPREWVYGAYGSSTTGQRLQRRPDPGGGGVVGRVSRVSLPWFVLESDGSSLSYPLLGSITSLAVNSFSGDQLPNLAAEIAGIMPHLTPQDGAAFKGFALIVEEVSRVGTGSVHLTPL